MNWDTAPQELEALRQQVAALTQERNLARNHAQRLGEQIGEEARINDEQLAALMKENAALLISLEEREKQVAMLTHDVLAATEERDQKDKELNKLANRVLNLLIEKDALTEELSECRNQYIGLEGMYGLLQQERDALQQRIRDYSDVTSGCPDVLVSRDLLSKNFRVLYKEIECRHQSAALTKDWNLLVKDRDALTTKLAASQAREARLRKALNNCYGLSGHINVPFIEKTLALPTDTSALDARLKEEKEALAASQAHTQRLRSAALELPPIVRGRELNEALALPDNTSALDARLAEERERMIHACEENGSFGAASIIRSLK